MKKFSKGMKQISSRDKQIRRHEFLSIMSVCSQDTPHLTA